MLKQYSLLLLLLLWALQGCATAHLTDAFALTDSQLRRLLVGHWYAQAFAEKGEPLLNWIEADYRADGSCVYTYMVRTVDPRTNELIMRRGNQGFGQWTVSSGKLNEHWERNSFPHNTQRMSTARILRAGPSKIDLSEEPFDSLVTYYRRLTIIPLNP